jgi:sec-independent protein translocase protein TatA
MHPIPLFGPVGPELLIVIFLIVLLFGVRKIPNLGRSTGEAIGEFKKGRQELEEELQDNPETEQDSETVTNDANNA